MQACKHDHAELCCWQGGAARAGEAVRGGGGGRRDRTQMTLVGLCRMVRAQRRRQCGLWSMQMHVQIAAEHVSVCVASGVGGAGAVARRWGAGRMRARQERSPGVRAAPWVVVKSHHAPINDQLRFLWQLCLVLWRVARGLRRGIWGARAGWSRLCRSAPDPEAQLRGHGQGHGRLLANVAE